MFSDDEIKELSENSFIQPGDEIISIHEVCLSDKFEKRDLALLTNPARYDLDITRSLYRDGFFLSDQQQAKFAWTEEDDNIAALVSDPGFGTTGHTNFGKDLEAALKNEADTSSSAIHQPFRSDNVFSDKSYGEPQQTVSSTSASANHFALNTDKFKRESAKVDKADPRSRFHFVKYLKRHGRTVKIWECGICSREFQHQYTLIRHVPTHTDERNFHCDACGKSFRQLSTLSQHRAIHSADRPYSCDVCRKTFNRVSTLISHRKTHSDDKPYKCHICPKGFHQKGNLRNHLFTHTNERPYRCSICNKGFNQQSNLVCHKNKTHPDAVIRETPPVTSDRNNVPGPVASPMITEPDSTIPPVEQCEVSSSVGPYPPSMEGPSTSSWAPKPWDARSYPEASSDIWTLTGGLSGSLGNGVIVEPIKTYHMGVALATRQTPFALLKPDHGVPVLVKVVDTKLPGGKQMLVPATADDLRFGGKVVVNNKDGNTNAQNGGQPPAAGAEGAVQIRVPVVATVVPRIRPGGGLQLAVQEPHHDYHTDLTTQVKVEGCTVKDEDHPPDFAEEFSQEESIHPLDPPPLISCPTLTEPHRNDRHLPSSCSLPPPPPSPPLDLISMDLFEHMDCIREIGEGWALFHIRGPQVTAVDYIDQPPPSDDSDIFIGEFEESIALSDSD